MAYLTSESEQLAFSFNREPSQKSTILMCRPDYFSVDYSINPWMEPEQWDNNRKKFLSDSKREWNALCQTLQKAGASVELVPPEPGLPDLVFTANAAVVMNRKALIARFRFSERQDEEDKFLAAFEKLKDRGLIDEIHLLPPNILLEGAGDCVWDQTRSLFWVGYGPRSSKEAGPYVYDTFGIETVSLELVNPKFYHMDTAICPLSGGEILYVPSAFDEAGLSEIHQRVPANLRIEVSEEDSGVLAANAVCLGRDIVISKCSDQLQKTLKQRGYNVHPVPLHTFHKSGGSAFCLTLRLDTQSKSTHHDFHQSKTVNPKIAKFYEEAKPQTPCLIIDLKSVEKSYHELKSALPIADIFYAVKANPAPEIVQLLKNQGSNFDLASRGEIELCLKNGVNPNKMSFGSTIKKEKDISFAYQHGIRMFAFDSEAELEKIARVAPESKVFCRFLVDSIGAEWPLSKKFGCSSDMAVSLLRKAKKWNLTPYGVSFHIGSQQTLLTPWDSAIRKASNIFISLQKVGIDLQMLNIGGGLPASYLADNYPLSQYASAIANAIETHFGTNPPRIIVEPGRSMVGNSGIIYSEVVLISKKSFRDKKRWVYLDVGKFHGLAETMNESIKYRLMTPKDGGHVGPVVLAGPTCDSMDILYEKATYQLPLELEVGDIIQILSTGAYTASYSSGGPLGGFNGFAPLSVYCI